MKRRHSPLQAALAGTAAVCGVALLAGSVLVTGQQTSAPPLQPLGQDPVALLAERIRQGKTKLDYRDRELAFLPSLLAELDVNVDSQLLVFSKTSLQSDTIGPKVPRAIYFNDDVFVGHVPNREVELAAIDPTEGVIFYTLEATPSRNPQIRRRDHECAQCHGGSGSTALVAQSIFPDAAGNPLFLPGLTPPPPDHTTPLEQRWGGWYVTGQLGSLRHMGNAVVRDPYRSTELEQEGTQNLTTLRGKADLRTYPAQTSDLIALMTFEHQLRMSNLISQIGRRAAAVAKSPTAAGPDAERLNATIEEALRYMLFVEEARLPEPIVGVSRFTSTFPARGPRDSRGRSLRDFDLTNRLFRFPLSYMIYSAAFDAIPDVAKSKLYQRLYDVLTDRDTSEAFARVSTADRRAVLEILIATKSNLPDYWKAGR